MEEADLSSLFDLTGKVAVVTGGPGIIGTRVCHGLAAFGADVAIVDIDGDAAIALAKDVAAKSGRRAIGIACDIAKPDHVTGMVERVVGDLGGIDGLLNNAAHKPTDYAAYLAPFEEYRIDIWRDVMATNIDGVFLVAQAVGKQMLKQGRGGSIIQTASTYGLVGPDPKIYEGSEYLGIPINSSPVYAASKAAVVGFTKYLATHWGPQGIRVNTLVPGGVESGQNEEFKAKYGARTPLGRMANRDELVGAVVYMMSDASTYMTGQMMVVDGGWTAW
ncbi:MAG: SDR family oxidoreductase [Rhodospirillaceae bacterium]|jgi:NAD(P)-dependent dehydrogenase (short-subunit alcohol dehydrogenase family)|nr:SDR family oxidoreductase [Rhodospirillaceae bacterium]MBT5455354.1 SDR family oxidoreductase [Rhodospirillaceae bacterium]